MEILKKHLEKLIKTLSSQQKNKYYSKGQHRGNIGEGQLHLKHDNIKEFQKYSSKPNELLEKIIEAYKRQKTK